MASKVGRVEDDGFVGRCNRYQCIFVGLSVERQHDIEHRSTVTPVQVGAGKCEVGDLIPTMITGRYIERSGELRGRYARKQRCEQRSNTGNSRWR